MSDTASDAAPVEFSSTEKPVASIIVLAWRLTGQLTDCLRSLAASVDAPPFEVILVLNGATPAVRTEVEARIRGAQIIDLDANVGFGGGCNAAALRSRGTYLILLNDDATVASDWLARIVDAAQQPTRRTGAVTSLLLNLDGTVQEAGSRIRSDTGTIQLGKGLSLDEAEESGLLRGRSVDYGSGAALLLSRIAFHEVGGFDPRFEPAYYEDVDLCLRLRLAGWDVVFEPSARVWHMSGASTNRDHRFRDFAASRSGTRFTARWAAALSAAPSPNAPLGEILDPSPLAGQLSDAPAEVRDPVPTTATALDIAQGYQDWLNRELDSAQENVLIERHLRASDKQVIDELTREIARLQKRLDDLEGAGLLRMLRWRAGVLVRRMRARRRIGPLKATRHLP